MGADATLGLTRVTLGALLLLSQGLCLEEYRERAVDLAFAGGWTAWKNPLNVQWTYQDESFNNFLTALALEPSDANPSALQPPSVV